MTNNPTVVAVQCANERSQLMNQHTSLKLLKEKHVMVLQYRRLKELLKICREAVVAMWGQRDDDGHSVTLEFG